MMIWILAAACVLLLLFYIRSENEKRHFTVDTYEVCSEKITEKERTFVFLSDLHDNRFGEGQKELLDAIAKVKPDGVMIGGDMMVTNQKKSEVDISAALDFIRHLAERYPVYYGMGNHESRLRWLREQFGGRYDEYMKGLQHMGVKTAVGHERFLIGEDISVAGLEIPERCYRRFSSEIMKADEIGQQIGTPDRERYQILLAHLPSMFRQYQEWGADLTLAGHFHGGTIRIPYLGGLMTPQFRFFDPYCGGIFEENGHVLVVSRGLGTHSVNIRFHNRAQLVVLKLKPKPKPVKGQ